MPVVRQSTAKHKSDVQVIKTNNKYCNKNKTYEQINDKIGTIREKNRTAECGINGKIKRNIKNRL